MNREEPSPDREIIRSAECEINAVALEHGIPPDSPSLPLGGMNAYRSIYSRALDRIADLHRDGAGGPRVCALIADLADCFIHAAFGMCFPEGSKSVPAVVALAGYGRRELSPFSDVDLLFLMDGHDRGAEDSRTSAMLRFLWDLNLDLGHSTRTPAECVPAAEEDTYLATSLLESRFLAGRRALWEDFRRRFSSWLRGGAGVRVAERKIGERNLRVESFNGTVQIQNPNLKESPGGLRDVHLVRWLAALSGAGMAIEDIERTEYLANGEAAVLRGGFEFLLRVRNALHFTAGKKNDLLNHVIIPDIAANLSYSGEGAEPMERLMREYYREAGAVFRLTNRAVGRFFTRTAARPAKPFAVLPIGLRTNDTHIALLREERFFLVTHPHLFVEIFTVAGACCLRLTEDSASVIEHTLHRLDAAFPTLPDVRASFHALMNLRTGAARAIRLMHEHGVLERLIPEFGAIGWHYQYDFYHAFTTDEHSLRTVEHLESMATGNFTPFPHMHEVMADVTARGALYLAGLLHDIGKAEGAAHSAHGERLAARALRRLGCDERTVALVRFLIREHLLMSHVTQRRDTDDPETIRDFIGRVRSAGRLRMLTALTFADLSALSEGALSDWKKTLLWSLYTRALLLIEQEYEHSAPSLRDTAARRAVERLRARIPEPEILTHLNSLPEQYLRVTPPSEIGAHIRGISLMERRGAWASFHRRRGLSYLTVICRDYPSALSDICGAITASDINIVAAQIFTRGDSTIIDTFLVVNGTGETRIPLESQRGFKRNFFRVIAGDAKAGDLIRDHILRWRRRRKKAVYSPPRVRIDNTVSSLYTVVDVFASDYTGLLYDITSVLAANGMDIHTARIGTDEDQAADAFYIRKSGGGKIEDERELEKLTREIVERLEKMRQ
jgi:[protein-PII] uridylyltransferase